MGGIAAIAKAKGFRVTGSDQHVYPPMSTQLEQLGIRLHDGWDPTIFETQKPDLVLVGNQLSRGNPMIEALLESNLPFQSAPQWLHEHILRDQWVMAVAGTHGKTTTTSMLAWILDQAGLQPGFLIGGKPAQFEVSARLGAGQFFVIEADEYDTAFFDKRSKFVHYWPKTCILNNLEFDHADIFDSLKDIQKQFHHLVRTVPLSGLVIHPHACTAIHEVLEQGCWSLMESVGDQGVWGYQSLADDFSAWDVYFRGQKRGSVQWKLFGKHQVENAISAIAAARHAGVDLEVAMEAISRFVLPKRRMELLGCYHEVALYDDFAHHPTAISLTLEGLRAKVQTKRIGVILDLRSNTMRAGIHESTLAQSIEKADLVAVYKSKEVTWPVEEVFKDQSHVVVFDNVDDIVVWFQKQACAKDHWVVMSNGGFDGIHDRLKNILSHQKKANKIN